MRPSIINTAKEEFSSPLFLSITLLAGLFYILIFLFIPGAAYSSAPMCISNPLLNMVHGSPFYELVFQIWRPLSSIDLRILMITSLLFGINSALILSSARRLTGGSIKLYFGGGSILALASGGCIACGLSILSFLGIGTALVNFLPLRGLELNILAIAILFGSAFYTLKKLSILACEIIPSAQVVE